MQGAGTTFAAFLSRDWAIDRSYRTAFALQIAAALLTLALFYYLGRVVDPEPFERQGLSSGYFGYVAVGLALMQLVQAGLTSFSRKLREEQTTGTFEALMSTPASPSLIILFSAVYDLLRAAVAGVLLLAFAALVFDFSIETDPLGLGAGILAFGGSIVLFAALGVAVAAFTVVFKRASGLLALIGAAFGLLGGVYFPVDVLPPALEAVANVLPFTWALDVTRAGLLGGEVEAGRLVALIAVDVVLVAAALALFSAALRRGRRTGTLAQY